VRELAKKIYPFHGAVVAVLARKQALNAGEHSFGERIKVIALGRFLVRKENVLAADGSEHRACWFFLNARSKLPAPRQPVECDFPSIRLVGFNLAERFAAEFVHKQRVKRHNGNSRLTQSFNNRLVIHSCTLAKRDGCSRKRKDFGGNLPQRLDGVRNFLRTQNFFIGAAQPHKGAFVHRNVDTYGVIYGHNLTLL
jgi:hypothetical protein